MSTALTGNTISATYGGLLKTSDNATLNGSLRTICDGLAVDSALQVSTAAVKSTGTFAVDGTSTFTGAVTLSGGLNTPLAIAQGGTAAATASAARTSLGIGTLGTQAAGSVAITGGSITGITDLAVADGGTGASTAADARTNLGLGSASQTTYATGSWTPSIGGAATYNTQSGTYVKIGRLVFIRGDLDLTARGGGSQVTISGLPFAAASISTIHVGYFDDSAEGVTYLAGLTNGSTIDLWRLNTTTNLQTLAATFFNSTTRIIFSGCYETDS